MNRRTSRWALVGALVSTLGCASVGPRTAPNLDAEALLAVEQTLAEQPLRYGRFRSEDHPWASPTGVYEQDGRLWVYSSHHPRQQGFALPDLRPVGSRVGPLRTRRCITAGDDTAQVAWCVGDREPGGIRRFPDGPNALPRQLGFRDLVRVEGGAGVDGSIWALDGVNHRLYHVTDGRHQTLPTGAWKLGPVGRGRIWVALQQPPWLASVAPDGRTTDVPRRAPIRDAAWDGADRLWLVGPANRTVRRAGGPLVGAGTEVVAIDADGFRRGDYRIVARQPFQELNLVDGTAIAARGRELAVAATGADAVMVTDGPSGRVQGNCLTPSAVSFTTAGLVTTCRLGDSLRIGERTLTLTSPPRDQLVDLGERLFYRAGLWNRARNDAITCNTCHWDTGSDHRVTPGFMERRQEMTRPLGGISAVTPIFSTGGSPHLTRAIEGLIRSLDPRLWVDIDQVWWEYPLTVAMKGGERKASAREIREALLHFVMSLPAEPPATRAVDQPLSERAREGWALFSQHCAHCHEPSRSMRTRAVPGDVPAWLRSAPLTFAMPGYARTGAGPEVTRNGNRIPPLMSLSRRGRWMVSGSAPTLEAVIRRTDRVGPVAHREAGYVGEWPDGEVAALLQWLREI